MREVLFKNLIPQNTGGRCLILSETTTKGNLVISTKRRSSCSVKESIPIKSLSNLDALKRLKKKTSPQKRHCYVIKKHDSKTGEDKLFCKIHGYLYIVMADCVHLVSFVNSFNLNVRKMKFNH